VGGPVSKIKLKYVQEYIDCRGKARRYVRRRGKPRIPLPGLPGSAEFMAAYESAIADDGHAPPPVRHKEGTISYLVARFHRSAAFTNLSPSSQKAYRLILDKFDHEDGHRLVRDMPKSVAASIIEEIGATRPGMANLTAATLKRLFSYAVKMDMRADNPFIGIESYEGGEHRAWADREIAAFEAKWPIGTRQRLAFDLLLFTGQRVGDVAAMRRADLLNGAIPVRQEKTGAVLSLPVHPDLLRSVKACAADGPAPLNTNGRPMTKRSIAAIVARAARSAGLPRDCKTHGLRKAALTRLANHHATTHEIQAVSGHKSLREVQRYTAAVDQSRLARSAMDRLPSERNETESV
jgi:enterobacteria phage integrase